jgi:hypothetical protein
MNIGILTYYRVANFGANLQAVSTYYYLKNNGYTPLFILYESEETVDNFKKKQANDVQKKEHIHFIDDIIPCQSFRCFNADDINRAIIEYNLDAIIIGSDAVLQHHPIRARIKKGKRKPFYIEKMVPERIFPNCFWGCGISEKISMAMMSVSSQNSEYKYFGKKLSRKMSETLSRMKYISVRDSWTRDMVVSITHNKIIPPVTPDPVFAFNKNAGFLVPSEESLREKYNLPQKYVLISLLHQDLTIQQMEELKKEFAKHEMHCIAFPMPVGIRFEHPFDYEIEIPLPVLDWYGLIKYASAYVGSNMHPIIVSLHNGTPCYSIDYWGTTDFWGNHLDDGSSKVAHILKVFNLEKNRISINKGKCDLNAKQVVKNIISFPREQVILRAQSCANEYEQMMKQIIISLMVES